jgi:hypothetical protein
LRQDSFSGELSRVGLPRRELNLQILFSSAHFVNLPFRASEKKLPSVRSEQTSSTGFERTSALLQHLLLQAQQSVHSFAQQNVPGKLTHSPVMAVTERSRRIGDTPIVNKVRRVGKNALFEPGDTE